MQAVMQAPVSKAAVFSKASPRTRQSCGRQRVAVVRASAEAQLPKGVTTPKAVPTRPPAKFGFVDNAERLNSRAAMIGFFGILIVEAIANQGILNMLGFTVGQGLPFEF